jgi:hypothetical protein
MPQPIRSMNTLKLIWLAFTQLARQVCLVPKAIANAVRQRQQQSVRDKNEAERLDRICNPLKYRGK